ncbi:MAG: class I SAM-dependent methyltransferase [Spirochaetales bacterium]|nr:class I SAM-dependent methyltransferase [Spirochaetales bacterium]
MSEHTDRIKSHFEEEAARYDEIIIRLIPYYDQMVEAVASSLPFERERDIHILDLGCGTGTLSAAVGNRFPRARFTLVDLSENMIGLAVKKLGGNRVDSGITGDFLRFEFPDCYDGVISSLALHHLETDRVKADFFNRIYNSLKRGGVFLNADVVLASEENLQQSYMKKWRNYMGRSVPEREIEEVWLTKYRQEDRPAPLTDQMTWLERAGFTKREIIWKYYNFAVYGGFCS